LLKEQRRIMGQLRPKKRQRVWHLFAFCREILRIANPFHLNRKTIRTQAAIRYYKY
jgi:phytoene/squalene synthetase